MGTEEEVFNLFGEQPPKRRSHVQNYLTNRFFSLDENLGGHVTGFLGRNAEDLVGDDNLAPQGEDAHPGTGWIHPPEEVDFATGWLEESEVEQDASFSLRKQLTAQGTPGEGRSNRKIKKQLRRLKWKERLSSPRTIKALAWVAGMVLFYFFFTFMIKSGSIV